MQLNPCVKSICVDSEAEEDRKFDVLAVTKMKNRDGIYKATIRVSNRIRSAISRNGDRLYVGSRSCKVYDSFYVRRCFNCQKFGHHSTDCTGTTVCGFCMGNHETRKCTTNKEDINLAGCTNCKNSKRQNLQPSDLNHPAYSLDCPSYKAEQSKLKQSIPFYQSQ